MLRIEHLTKKFGEKKAVDDLSLHIQKGGINGFIGHKGAGKTPTSKGVGVFLTSMKEISTSMEKASGPIAWSARRTSPTFQITLISMSL